MGEAPAGEDQAVPQRLVAWIDGSTPGQHEGGENMAGWAWVTDDGREDSGSEVAKSGRAELLALVHLLAAIEPDTPLLVKTDSEYLDGGHTRGWKAKKNLDLVAELKAEMAARDVQMEWVPREQNTEADRLAGEAARRGAEEAAKEAAEQIPAPADLPVWTARHFSQSNPKGPGQDDVPSLLRRVAESIEGLGPVDVHDLTFGTEVTQHGSWHRLTVYFTPKED